MHILRLLLVFVIVFAIQKNNHSQESASGISLSDSLLHITSEQIKSNKITTALSTLSYLKTEYADKLDSGFLKKVSLNEAQAYIIINDYEKALEILYSVIDSQDANVKDKTLAEIYNKTGWINLELADYKHANNYFLKAQNTIPDSLLYSAEMAGIYNNLGIVNHKQAKYTEALTYYKKAINIFDHFKDEHGLSIGEINIGIVYFKNGELSKAQQAFNRALSYAKLSNTKSDKIVAFVNLGKVENKKGHYQNAILYYTEALDEAQKIKDNRLVRKSLYSLYVSYEEMNDWKNSLNYFKLYSQLRDSVFNSEMASKFAEMQTRYETHQKEQENAILKKEKVFQTERLNTQNKLLLFSILLIVSLTAFGMVFFFQRKKQYEANKELLKKNIEIVNSEKALLMTKSALEKRVDSLENTSVDATQKYESSALTDNKKEELYLQIISLVEKEKLFINPEISTSIIAQKLNTNKNYISQVINEFNKSNFNHFINEYRIKEARILFSDNDLNKYTIEAIGNIVGFKSKSSFYQAFKKFTGLTPSFYINNIKRI